MIGILKYLPVWRLAECQDHLIMSTSDFAGACSKANNRGYQKGRADAIDEYMDVLCDYCMQQNNDCCKTECPFCVSGCYIVVKAEQLKEQKNG